MDEIFYQSVRVMAAAIRGKEVSAQEVVRRHLERIDEVNGALNAVVTLCDERAVAEAAAADAALAHGDEVGPLHGVPMTLKDSLDTEAVRTTGGTTGRREFVPDEDATLVARLRAAGAILLGKTNTPELTMAAETDNLVFGRTANPFDQERTPGGSSGGAAAIVCCGGSAFDIGSDTGGSIRIPAHFCGVAGIKPNSGRVPRTGHIIPYGMGVTDALTQNGPLARTVADLALLLPLLVGPDWHDPAIVPMPLGDPAAVEVGRLRVAWYADNGLYTPTDETVRVVGEAVAALADAGAAVEEHRPDALALHAELSQSGGDGRASHRRLLQRYGTTEVHPWLVKRFIETDAVSPAELTALYERQDEFRSRMLGFMRSYDAILCPVAAYPAPVFEGTMGDDRKHSIYTGPYNLTGWPATAVRCGASAEGLPIGLQVVARPWREDVSLALAQVLEDALGGWQAPPL